MTEPPDHASDGWAVVHVPLDSEPPGPISTEEDDEAPELPASGRTPEGPPGGRIFSLEGRPAAGLYLVAWLLALIGFGVLFITFLAASEGIRPAQGVGPIFGLIGTGLLGLGLATAGGYQVVARAAMRPPQAYRGPSPLIVFGVALLVVGIASLLLEAIGLDPTGNALGFLANLAAVEVGYLVVVLLFVVRSHAMTWREMGWPVRRPPGEVLVDVLYGAALMVPTVIGIGFIALVVSGLLGGVKAPDIVPTSSAGSDVLLLALATIVVAPVGEELFFRGFALSAWWRDLGVRSALIRSALFFALIHIVNVTAVDFDTGVRQVVLILAQIIPLGFVLGWLFVRRGIVASIAGHAAYNAVIFLAVLSVRGLPNV